MKRANTPTTPARLDFPPPYRPESLTVRDLLQAREDHHNALSMMPNVIATAIGRYRFHADDKPEITPRKTSTPRTLLNSRVGPKSWPAVLVFVRKWDRFDEVCHDPLRLVPQFLYLNDGRAVATCVIALELDQDVCRWISAANQVKFPENRIGGGCGVYTHVQGQEHVGTLACLTTDGERTYGLTAQHVAGPPGERIFTRLYDKEQEVGKSHDLQIRKVPFRSIYPEYPGTNQFLNLDAGFIRLDEADIWTSQVLGIGELDDLIDLNTSNITLGMIGAPVRAFGAISKDRMRGEICALFPRFRSMGGDEYLADVLVSARDNDTSNFKIAGGDSGALWVLDDPIISGYHMHAKPLAATWGAVDFIGGGRSCQLVLATFLSNVCKATDMELVTHQNIGYRPIWSGKKHVKLSEFAANMLIGSGGNLEAFLTGGSVDSNRYELLTSLAKLPDEWKGHKGRKDENPNHYANINLACGGRKLKDIPLDPKQWLEFYKNLQTSTGEKNRGALPFRVGDVFTRMQSAVEARRLNEAFAAAGILAHYISDACNPAHVNCWGRGDPAWDHGVKSRWGGPRAEFHGVWDDPAGIEETNVRSQYAKITNSYRKMYRTGDAAAEAAMELMKKTLDLVDVKQFIKSGDPIGSKQAARDFCKYEGRDRIACCIAHGTALLLALWRSAWGGKNNNGFKEQHIQGMKLAGLRDKALKDQSFLPSLSLESLAKN